MRSSFKKSQIQAQVFVYLIALFAMSFFLLYAYRFIVSYQKNIQSSELVKFIKDLNSVVSDISASYKTVKTYEFTNFPRDFKTICFINLYSSELTVDNVSDPIIKNVLRSRPLEFSNEELFRGLFNVFLINDITEFAFFVNNLWVEGDVKCVNLTRKKLKLTLEGIGRKASLNNIE
ncbi:MAG: hypothetical protein QW524_02585 [Candidatus Woesearchaeota archaeon]